MIGKASEIKTESLYSSSLMMSAVMNEWLEKNSDVTVLKVIMNTYVMNDEFDVEGSHSEALIIYKEA